MRHVFSPEEIKELRRLCRQATNQTRKLVPSINKRWGTDIYDKYSLTGLCAIASALLYIAMKPTHPQVHLAIRNSSMEGHCFVVYRGMRLDPTAMQYGSAGPLVEPCTSRDTPWQYKRARAFATLGEFTEHLKRRGWPQEQRPDDLVVQHPEF